MGSVCIGWVEGTTDRLVQTHSYRGIPSTTRPAGRDTQARRGKRTLGIAALEDKIVQKAVTDMILTPIFEEEFLGFSYGF